LGGAVGISACVELRVDNPDLIRLTVINDASCGCPGNARWVLDNSSKNNTRTVALYRTVKNISTGNITADTAEVWVPYGKTSLECVVAPPASCANEYAYAFVHTVSVAMQSHAEQSEDFAACVKRCAEGGDCGHLPSTSISARVLAELYSDAVKRNADLMTSEVMERYKLPANVCSRAAVTTLRDTTMLGVQGIAISNSGPANTACDVEPYRDGELSRLVLRLPAQVSGFNPRPSSQGQLESSPSPVYFLSRSGAPEFYWRGAGDTYRPSQAVIRNAVAPLIALGTVRHPVTRRELLVIQTEIGCVDATL
jgi:hypothetical protein